MATHDPAVPGIAPDLVRDAQLQTEFLSEGRIRQTTRESASNEETDSAQRVQVWKRAQTIGRGAFDTTWLETCVEGTCKGQVRAVKVFQGISPDLALSGLEKAFKFSQDRVCYDYNAFKISIQEAWLTTRLSTPNILSGF